MTDSQQQPPPIPAPSPVSQAATGAASATKPTPAPRPKGSASSSNRPSSPPSSTPPSTSSPQQAPTPSDTPKGSPHTRNQSSAGAAAATNASQRIGPYLLGKTLGVGSTGRVKLGTHMETNHRVAIKIISKDSLSSSDDPAVQNLSPEKRNALNKKIEREITIMKLIQHPNIMQLYDVYETEKELFLILEHVEGGELFDYLVKRGRLHEEEALQFFQQIIFGVDYCHKHLICHRDLKPENLLLDKDRNVKIADFGMASLQVTGKMLETSCGSPHYASPEIIKGIKYDGPSADLWSCGVILYALLTGNLPFDDENIRRLLLKVKQGNYQIPDHVSAPAKDLIRRMLVVDPVTRITIAQVMEHPWFTSKIPPNISQLKHLKLKYEQGTVAYFAIDDPTLIDREVVGSLTLLGWGEEADLVEKLTRPGESMEKVFYGLLCQRKVEYFENYDPARINEWDIEGGPRRRADSYASLYADRGSRFDLFRSEVNLNGSEINLGAAHRTNSEALRAVGRRSTDELVTVRKSAEELRVAPGNGAKEASIDTRKSLDTLNGGAGSGSVHGGHEKVASEAAGGRHERNAQARRVVSESAGRIKIPTAASKINDAHVRVNSPLAASINFFEDDATSKPPAPSSPSPASQEESSSRPTTPIVMVDGMPTTPGASRPAKSEAKRKLTINTMATEQNSGIQPVDSAGVESPRFHRKKGAETAPPTPTLTSTPKRSWFANLFNFKPEVFVFETTVKHSLANVTENVQRLLKDQEVRFQVRKEGGFKCKYDGLASSPMGLMPENKVFEKQVSGQLQLTPNVSPGGASVLSAVETESSQSSPMKSVKFKIDITAFDGNIDSGLFKIQMTQQQGAFSTFQMITKRIKESWESAEQTPNGVSSLAVPVSVKS
ncbi:hypothetical protein HDU97_003369 [Phlyctochytrium planicorne]|nr:hypothetical protein HDU97_003369 [Phlyctochytrium planicorne]